ncbi:nucleoside phosphorylase domain-containing protein [Phaeosphaeriaceae sp. PMI808]|nr:nucleoside phosphorylase domain-containing protein [Phaeosphaeriaceae sp. PMI808]
MHSTMSGDTVVRLAVTTPSTCQSQTMTWKVVAQQLKCAQVQVIFASTESFVSTEPQIRNSLEKELGIPPSFFDRLYLNSNGFAEHDVRFDRNEKIEVYTNWSRFLVKQTYDRLKPKRTFTPHISNQQLGIDNNNNHVAVHGPQSVQHGWEWYEMGFFTSWKPSGSLTLICFDLPTISQSKIQERIGSHIADNSSPHSLFLVISDELLRLYDDSVWSIRNHISQWEARRSVEANYLLLHELARHSVHVNETLSVAIRSLDTIRQHHGGLRASIDLSLGKGNCNEWDMVGNRLISQLHVLQNLLQRSSANNARIQNEITLFTVGWISPLPIEKEAARLVLDEEYPKEDVQHQNTYYLGGRIGQHKVVIGVQRKIGLSGAAVLAEKMRAGFPNIKYFVLVGIAGGVPRYGPTGAVTEIVLGDVVVSSPRGNHGGVLQYDKGAWQGEGRLNFRGHTNGIPGDLLAAVNNFRAQGWSKMNVSEILKQMRGKLDEKQKHQYDDPGPNRDRLYEDEYEHKGTELDDCKVCCDPDYTISRSEREGATRMLDEPFVHFGNIASSNQLQISARERNRIQLEHEAICFEMEAAGVMEEYPCVVVRGICDYADSHKNKGWQDYAAATAAACAKGLLSMIPPAEVRDSEEHASLTPAQRMAPSSSISFGNNNQGFQAGNISGGVSGLTFGTK